MKKIKLITRIFYLIIGLVGGLIAFTVLISVNPEIFKPTKIDLANWKPKSIASDLAGEEKASLIKYGYSIITESSKHIGPLAPKASNRYAGNNLSCQNCHLNAGTKPGSASFVGVANRFPQFRGRENKIGTLTERVNGCMERSMNGTKLPENSLEMQGIIAYMEWLSSDVPEEKENYYKGFAKVKLPNEKADLVKGKAVFEQYCQVCHMESGQGQRPSADAAYLYPPLWGTDTYNHGAGMHRVITAAEFIKGNMPYLQATLEKPVLTDEEAYHVAAYINSFARPLKANTEADFPDKKLKPVSTPYGPWEDDFSAEQHKYGPFQPMMEFYQSKFGIKKSK